MNKCVTCRWSFAACEYGESESGEFNLRPILKCWPRDDRTKEQLSLKPCDAYEQEPPIKNQSTEREE